jgi:anti-sigma B factor antagonist
VTYVVKDYRRRDGVHVVQVDGAFDLHASPMVKETFRNVLNEGARWLVLDLSETTFIDSTAMSVLIGVMKRLRRSTGGRLTIACTNLNVIATFEMAGLDGALPIRLEIEDAVGALEHAAAR